MTTHNRIDAEKKLKEVFGIDCFYDEQWAAIETLLRGERILMVERTGFGKSLCYQFPALLFTGVTVVFSPLIALMRDQVQSLREKGISAAYINSEQSVEDNAQTIAAAMEGKIKILYIAPERQENHEWIEATRRMRLSMVVIDEAHTVSTWGHDFRPAFRRIIDLVQLLPATLPVLATTATATKRVQHDIEQQIGGRLTTIRGSLARSNFSLQVIIVHSEEEKMSWIAANINAMPGTGLIYTGTRIDTDIYARWLRFMDVNAIDYNAGLDATTRQEIEQGLKENKYKCVVSTNALGMGIDKPDIRFIIHTQIPASPIHYFQEIGRAGRDGQPTRAILFYNETKENGVAADNKLPLSFIETARPPIGKYQRVIALLKEESLTERQIIQKANLKMNHVRTIKSDLIEQGIIKEVLDGKAKTYEYQYNAKPLDTVRFEQLREAKIKDLNAMVDYVYTTMPRMEYLCRFLDSEEATVFTNCDNTTIPKETVIPDVRIENKLARFKSESFPELPLATYTSKVKSGLKLKVPTPKVCALYRNNEVVVTFRKWSDINGFTAEEQTVIRELVAKHATASRLTDGYAATYYGVSNVGRALHHSKYEGGGDFPDWLLRMTLTLFEQKYSGISFDLVLYVPPTHSGDLVKNFAVKLADAIGVPISHGLIKTRQTAEQKTFLNSYNKRANVADAFGISSSDEVKGKTILLIDDIYDSGETLKEVGTTLTKQGAKWIVPIVIAKTVGGTL